MKVTWLNLLAKEPNICLFTKLYWLLGSKKIGNPQGTGSKVKIIDSIVAIIKKIYCIFQKFQFVVLSFKMSPFISAICENVPVINNIEEHNSKN